MCVSSREIPVDHHEARASEVGRVAAFRHVIRVRRVGVIVANRDEIERDCQIKGSAYCVRAKAGLLSDECLDRVERRSLRPRRKEQIDRFDDRSEEEGVAPDRAGFRVRHLDIERISTGIPESTLEVKIFIFCTYIGAYLIARGPCLSSPYPK